MHTNNLVAGDRSDVVPRVAHPLPPADSARFLSRLLVATDGSEDGERAVTFAVALAQRHSSAVEFCFAVDHAAAIAECSSIDGSSSMVLPLIGALDDEAHAVVARARDRAKMIGLDATTCVPDGSPASAIIAEERFQGCDAIVMGTQGARGLRRLFLGSTADGVVRRTSVPVFVVPQGVAAVATFDEFLVAVDDSDPSDAAIAFAISFAQAEKARLIFCGVADTTYLNGAFASDASYARPMIQELHEEVKETVSRATERARDAGVTSEWVVIDGVPQDVIPRMAANRHVGAIVLGTHGRRGLRRLFVGSVAESVVQLSSVPVVVVRPAPGPPRSA